MKFVKHVFYLDIMKLKQKRINFNYLQTSQISSNAKNDIMSSEILFHNPIYVIRKKRDLKSRNSMF